MTIALILVALFLILFCILAKRMYKPEQIWNIALFEQATNNLDILKIDFSNPIVRFSPTSKVRTNYHYCTGYADPFLFVDDEWLYLFYEEERLKAPAPICAYRTKNLKKWENIGVVLIEDFHLSYPNTFRVGDSIYMLPETRSKDAVIVYKSVEFPYKWKPIVIVEGDKFTDSSILWHNGYYFLFTTVWYGETNGLRIYFSDSIESVWKEHPMSPVHNDIAYSRCGGAVFSYKDKLYRPAQDCSNYYGENVVLYEITELTIDVYSEKRYKALIDKNNSWSRFGGHHFNTIEFQGKTLVVMDGIVNDSLINNLTRKFFNYFDNKRRKNGTVS